MDDLADMQTRIRLSLENSRCENVATILFSREEAALETTEELLEAVEGKYNALNDKLLAEALMKQVRWDVYTVYTGLIFSLRIWCVTQLMCYN